MKLRAAVLHGLIAVAACLAWGAYQSALAENSKPAAVKKVRPAKSPVIAAKPAPPESDESDEGKMLDIEDEKLAAQEKELLLKLARNAGIVVKDEQTEASEVSARPVKPTPQPVKITETPKAEPVKIAKAPQPVEIEKKAPVAPQPDKKPELKKKPEPCEPATAKVRDVPAENTIEETPENPVNMDEVMAVKSKVDDLEQEYAGLRADSEQMHQALRNLQDQVKVLSDETETPRARFVPAPYVLNPYGAECADEDCDAASPQAELSAIVVSERAILRAGPNRQSIRVMTLGRGAKVEVEQSGADWSRVVTRSGVRAWLPSESLAFD